MKKTLKALRLRQQERELLTPDTFGSMIPDVVVNSITNWSRPINLDPLAHVVAHAMDSFGYRVVESDAWLAPRVHATLRLTRSEAAERSLWDYLSVIEFPEYVRWRWTRDSTGLVDLPRILGPDHRHAIARLWWSAELTRNGGDYGHTVKAFTSQTAIQFILESKAFHNRAGALGFIKFLSSSREGKWALDHEIPKYFHAFNYALSTTVLDSFAPDEGPHIQALSLWRSEEPDALLMIDKLPLGPDEPAINEFEINSVVEFLARLKAKLPNLNRMNSDKSDSISLPAA